ncbi:Ribophorin I [Kalmanozyma brasiliensis GHG001]|uniref:Dolichyl-diphosphooligosaccharide--protein glycosyltransferase subunit 1 n=1 Tax=Kalmanozyma brasiliensis (strain GHG001) TaxID=1365824 RepID=V5EXB8_KALBG|nr:Ribophorin I [Kalmanozyma brasiliensis GHG001]EST08103.1 Ribophorin I [Kalmanozyma brasiliensis GHG001]
MARSSRPSAASAILVLLATLLALCTSMANAVLLPSSNDWINSNYVKQIDLTGSTSHTLTTISIRPKSTLSADVLPYYFLLSAHEAQHLSWSRMTIKPALDSPLASSSEYKGGVRPLIDFSPQGAIDGDTDSYLFEALVPTSVLGADGATLTLETTLNHITTPLPETVKQTDPQLFLWNGDAAIRSPYTTDSGRIKVKAASPRIVSFTPEDATKSGSIVTYGPFERVAPYSTSSPVAKGSVHFQADAPRATIVTLDRTAEISHWGDALSITDRMLLRNAGPKLKGHFSRIEHQMSSFYNRASGSALSTLTFTLPAGTKDPWFIDQIGNVSTSRFRSSSPDPSLLTSTVGIPATQALISRLSLLELQPRFPLLGGWNYTFGIGYTLPLSSGGWTKRIAGSDDYLTAIPLFTPLKDVAVDELSTTIVLPEGATRVSIELPFPMDNVDNGIVKTYLDTMGRPAVQLTKKGCSSEHAQLVYVKYTLTHRANMVKVAAVAVVTGALLLATAVLQRVETKIK